MKKLKAALILLLALTMSLCLFACGGGKDNPGGDNPGGDNPGGDNPGVDDSVYRKIEVEPKKIELTDSAEQTALDAAYAEVTVTATTYDGDEVELKLSDCNYTSNVKLHEVGEYSFPVTLKSDDSKSATLTVVIDHDWGEETGGVKVCKYDQARQETKTEDVVIHYGTFHEGTGAALPADSGWTETGVYTNKGTNSAIKEFGSVNGRNVPTLTAGQLEPGTTITIRGTAKTTAGDNDVWKKANEYWNIPSLGIADRFNTRTQNNANANYRYGVSVIVRQEGWVLYNGIGDTNDTTTLGGIMNGYSDTTDTWRNFGSHPNETETTTPGSGASGYVHGVVPADWSNIGDWWVYSSGDGMNSGDDYQSAEEYEYTWNYREDGVVEIVYKNLTSNKTLKIYIKVPDSSVGYYDTIVHGDYSDMTITESVITTKRTPKDFQYNGVKSGENKVYAENTEFDAKTLAVQVKYEQTGDAWNDLQLTNSQVYRYVGAMDRAALANDANELNSTEPDKWVSLANSALKAGAIYKIHLSKGGKEFIKLIGENDFTVLPNKVVSAEGADVTIGSVAFNNNHKLGAIAFSVESNKIALTLESGYVQTLSAEQKAAFGGNISATKYVALRLNAGELGNAFTTEDLKVNNGNVPVLSKLDGVDLYLVLALTEAGTYTVAGAQKTDIVLNFAALGGFTLDSKIEGSLKLNAGGDLTITYTLPAGATGADLKLELGGYPITVGEYIDPVNAPNGIIPEGSQGVGDYLLKEVHLSGTELKLVVGAKAANLANYAPASFKLTYTKTGDSIADTVDYAMEIDDTAKGYVSSGEDNYYAFVPASGALSVIRAISSADVKNGTVSGNFTLNINNGNFENFKKYGLLTVNYQIVDGELVLLGAPSYISGYAKIVGTYGDSRDADVGAYVVISVDVTNLGISGEYCFEFNNGETFDSADTAKPTSLNKVFGTQVSSVNVEASDCAIAIVVEGTCQQQGLYAWEVKQDDKVIYYAKAAVAGGVHVDENEDDTCDLCGATISAVKLTDNEANQENILNDGEFVEISGTYNDVAHKGLFNGIETNVRNNGGDAFYVRVRNDGYYARETGNESLITLDYNSTTETHGVEAGTVNGVPNGVDGTPIDETSYLAAKKGGTFKVYASYVNGLVTVVTKLWTKDQTTIETPYFQYTVKMTVVSKDPSIKVRFRIDSYQNDATITTAEDCSLVKGEVSHSMIESVAYSAVDGHAAPTGMTISNKGNYITLSGNAAAESGNYYAAFKVTFTSALVENTTVTVRKNDGSEYPNATAKLNDGRTELFVYLPLNANVKSATIDFVNFLGITIQNDLTIDLNGVFLSDVKVTADKQDLKLAGDTFTLTYTGTIPATAKLAIGENSVELSALTSASVSAPVAIGTSLFSVIGYNNTTKAVTLKYAGVADYMKDLAEVEIKLTDANGGAIARISVYPNTLEGLANKIESSGWYLVAVGGRFMLISDKAEADTLPVIINAGRASDVNAVGVYNLGYKGGKFVDSNLATAAANVVTATLNEKTVTALVITVTDLTGLGITETGAYGVMLAVDDATKYYAIAADRAISEQDAATGTEKELSEHSCEEVGKSGKTNADESFYWSFSVTPSHSYPATDTNGYYVCTECGAILKSDNVKNSTVPADLLTVEGDQTRVDTGLSVSFWATVGDSDWVAVALKTSNNLIITLPNLDPWNATGDASSKFKGYNKFPAGDEFINGSAYSVFLNGASYVTISLSKTGGVTYYKNGVKVIAYAATTTFNLGENQTAITPTPTVAMFVEEFLKDVATNGLILASGLTAASDAIIEAKTYTDEEALTRYNNYVAEKDYYPVHTHSFGEDDKCACGELNPNHGDTSKGGKAHSYDPATDKCTMCGEFNPNHTHKDEHNPDGTGGPDGICDVCGANLNHQHSYEDGICTGCGSVCDHADEAGATCSKCGATIMKDAHFDSLTAWSDAYRSTTPLTKGHRIVVYGKQKSPMTGAWNTINWELTDGYTGRLDNFGWTFGNVSTFSQWNAAETNPGESKSTLIQIRDNTNKVIEADWFVTFKEIAKDCLWRVEAYWQTADVINVKCTLTALSGTQEGNSFDIVYAIKLIDMTKTELGFRITADGTCPSIDVTGHFEGEIPSSAADAENALPE